VLKQLFLPFAAVAIFIVLVGLFVKNSGSIKIPNFSTPSENTSSSKTITVDSTVITVEIADTVDKRTQGLSGRTDLLGDSGMLFVFDKTDRTPGFWMKGMLIPLDLIWIRDGIVVKIDKNVNPPEEGTPDEALPIYVPGQVIDHVLEVRGGYSEANKISVGSKVDLSGI